jgi:hypothetical protein
MLRVLRPVAPRLRSFSSQVNPVTAATALYGNEAAFTHLQSAELSLSSSVKPEHKWLPWTTLRNTSAKDINESFIQLYKKGKLKLES